MMAPRFPSFRPSAARRESRNPWTPAARNLLRRGSWIPDSRCRGFRNDLLLVLRSLNPVLVERRLHAAAVELQRALGADRVGTLEDPVLPGGQAAEDFRLHR